MTSLRQTDEKYQDASVSVAGNVVAMSFSVQVGVQLHCGWI